MARRVAGHELIWMAITRGQCQCGEDYFLDPDEMDGLSDREAQDAVLDKHCDHLRWLLEMPPE